MKLWLVSLITIVAVAAGWLLRSIPFKNANATTEAAHRKFDQHLKKIISTAESMPISGYAYAPTDSDDAFIEVANRVSVDVVNRCGHLVNVNDPGVAGFLKAIPPIKGRHSPDAVPAQFKNDTVTHLKTSADLCDQVFKLLNDSQLNELVTSQGDQKVTKAESMMDLLGEVAKAESEMNTYWKLNGNEAQPR